MENAELHPSLNNMATTTMLASAAVMATGENSPESGMISRPPPSTYLTVDGLIRKHASEDGDLPMIGYPVRGNSDHEVHTVKTVDRYVDAACWWYKEKGLEPADPSLDQAPVVALLTPSCLDAIISFFALNRLGYAVLFLSTRLTPPAYVSLMHLAKCETIVYPPIYKEAVEDMQSLMNCKLIPRINSTDYRPTFNVPRFFRECDSEKESKKIAWIIHSSGTTGFPKPIFITNFGCLANWQKGLGLRSFTVSPLFHSHALHEFGRAIYAKKPMYFGNHGLPVTRQNVLAAMRVAKPEMVCAVPYVLKLLAEKEEGIMELAKAKIVMYGGSACPDALGDELVSKGVNLAGNYGATETGFIMNSFRPKGDLEWNYLRLHRPVADHVLMDEIAPGLFECVALDGLASKVTINSDNPPKSFRTKDLFTRHPDPAKPNFWKYASRSDDRLTLVNGEKVLPLPIEGHIRQHDLIKEAAVFGFQKTVPGVLIFKSEAAAGMSDADFLDRVWPQVEAANSQAESFSRIPKDLVIVRPFEEVYPRTDKGTIIRAQLYEQYAGVIKQAYSNFESGNTGEVSRPLLCLEPAEIETFLLSKFREDLSVSLDSSVSDIFAAGVDSLQTTRLWNIIKKELDLGGNHLKFSQNAVFERGTVHSLAQHLYNIRMNIDEEESGSVETAEIATMQNLISKYSEFTPHSTKSKTDVSSKTVLLTGATGGLGSILLSRLLRRSDVSQVFALVRAATPSAAHGRIVAALESRNLLNSLSETQLQKFIALPADLSSTTLGLDQDNLEALLSSVTHIIHSAWAVNFNLPLLAFEAQHIRGVYNLIQHIALRTTHSRPAEFFFCSSISAASGTPKPASIAEVRIADLHHAQKMGYGRSKLVSEHITYNAMQATGMHSRVLRIGQLAGDTKEAYWNDTEAIALMIRSALPESAGCLPSLNESPSWLPVDNAAEVIEELVLSKSILARPAELAYHVLNPCTFGFQSQFIPMLTEHPDMPQIEVVDTSTWLERLRASDEDVKRNPSRKLLEFWDNKYAAVKDNIDSISKGSLDFETKETVHDSYVLGNVRDPVSDGLMSRIVSVWLKKWREELQAMSKLS